jgi:predicted PurR-regulated permease PerM
MSSDDVNLKYGQLSTRALVLFVLLSVVVLYFAIDLLLLLFAGVLFAIFLRTLAEWVSQYTRLSPRWGLLVVVLVLVGLGVGLARFTAPQLAEQVDQLTETVPVAIEQMTERIEEYAWGEWLVRQVRSALQDFGVGDNAGGDGGGGRGGRGAGGQAGGGGPGAAGDDAGENGDQGGGMGGSRVITTAQTIVGMLTSAIISAVIVLFVGLYLAFDPDTYRRGVLRLVPKRHRRRGAEVLGVVGYTLQWWLFGQLIAMLVVGTVMGVGLAVLGVPLALALGVLAGLLEFIPTFGPPLAFIPALLLALQQGTDTALWVLGLYAVLQTGEAYMLTPLIQQRAVHLPPVVTIAAQVFLGTTLGPLGLLVAVPLVAVILVLVKMLYVQDKLGDDVDVDGEEEVAKKTRRDPDAVP